MRSRGVGLAHVGRVRTNNEDCWVADDQLGLYAVADGMGGKRGGEVAAATAIDAVTRTVRAERALVERVHAGEIEAKELMPLMNSAIQEANRAVHAKAQETPGQGGMGCTLTVLLVAGERGIMGHVGDSRLYFLRGQGLHLLSEDQTIAAQLVREGVLTPDKLKTSPYRAALSQAIGSKPVVRPDFLRFALVPGDRVLLCSDGFSNYLEDESWLRDRLLEEDFEGIPNELVRFANEAGGGDNVTAVVIEVDPEPSAERLAAAERGRAELDALAGTRFCQDLSLARQARILSHCGRAELEAGALVVEAGANLPGWVLVVEGSLALERGEEVLGTLTPGDYFGSGALLAPRPARVRVRAQEDAVTLTLTLEELRALTRRRPRLGGVLLRRVARELAEALDERLAQEERPAPRLAP